MRRTLATLTLLTALVPFTRAQLDAPTKRNYVTYVADPQSIPAGQRAELHLRFQLLQGFHVNSHTPKSPSLIPTALTLAPAPGVKPGDPVFPPGQPFSFSFDPKEKIDVYANSFTVRLPIVATAGAHTMDASLRYQACDNSSCYPPRTLPVKIIFTAK